MRIGLVLWLVLLAFLGGSPVAAQTGDERYLGLGGTVGLSFPVGQQLSPSLDLGGHIEVSIPNQYSIRGEIAAVSWELPHEIEDLPSEAQASLRRITVAVIKHPDGRRSYVGGGFGAYRYKFSRPSEAHRTYAGFTALGGLQSQIGRTAVAAELQGHLIGLAFGPRPPSGLEIAIAAVVRFQWRF